MKHTRQLLKIVFCLTGILLLRPAWAQPISSNRFLFIVETSKAMKKQLPAAAQSVQELLASSLGGQLRAGDTLGIWTYDSELRAGVFPMQIWTERNHTLVANDAAGFLSEQKPKGRARLE